MAFTNLRNTSNVAAPAGSPYAMYAMVSNPTAYALETFYSFPMLIDSNYSGTTEKTEIAYEDDVKKTLSSTATIAFSVTLAQRDGATKNLIEFELPGETICFVKEEHTVAVGGQYQYIVYPKAEFTGDFTANAKGVEREVNFTCNAVDTLTTFNASALTSNVTGFKADLPAVITIPAGQAYARILVSA